MIDGPRRVHPALAASPFVLLGFNLAGAATQTAWRHIRRARPKQEPQAASHEESEPLIAHEEAGRHQGGTRDLEVPATGYELLLEALHIITAIALVTISVTRLQAGEEKWQRVFEGGVLATAIYLVLSSLVRLLDERLHQIVRNQQLVLGAGLALLTFVVELLPFVYVEHPTLTLFTRLGMTQAGLALALCTILLLTPPRFVARSNKLPPNPAQTASLLSRLFFSFLEGRMIRYFVLTSRRLRRYFSTAKSEEDCEFKQFVPPLPDVLHSRLVLEEFRWQGPEETIEKQENRHEQSRSPSTGTTWCFLWRYRMEVLEILLFASAWIVFVFLSPLSMNLLLRYVQSSQAPPAGLSPYLFVVGIFVSPIATSICYQSALYRLAQLGLRLRALLGVAVFEKLMQVKAGGGGSKSDDHEGQSSNGNGKDKTDHAKSSGSAGGGEAVGRVNNLVGTDVDVITSSLTPALELFGIVPKLLVSLIFLYFLLGWSAFVALGVIIAFAPVSSIVSKKYGGVQEEIMKATDKRVTLVQELLNSIRILKMFAWEKPSIKRISAARSLELSKITKRAKIYSGMMFLSTGIPASVTLATFGCYVFVQKESLTASTAFTAMSLFSLLREAVISATRLLSAFMRANVSLGRINSFIQETEQLDDQPVTFSSSKETNRDEANLSIKISDASFRFSRYGSSGFTLQIKELSIPNGSTTIIAGDVGSGKSALLLALLGELNVRSGTVKINSENGSRIKTSYAAQSPWLQDTSIRNNILFGEEYDEQRYNDVVFACALENDIENLTDGDDTRCGEKGLSLSGGQKQRICLARAVYARSQLVLLDDVLSALDSGAVSHVIEHCLNGPLLEGRTVVLVTHFVKLCVRRLESCSLVVNLRNGKVVDAAPPSRDLSAGGSAMNRSNSGSSIRSNRSNRSNRQDHHVKHGSGDHHANEGDSSGSGSQISWQVYRQYFTAMGGWMFWTSYVVVNLVAHVFMLAQGWWIGQWVNAPTRDSHAAKYFSIYAAIQVISAASLTAMYLALIAGGIRASRVLYTDLTRSMFSAPFRWWDRTPLGNAINRHTKDLEITDTEQVDNLQPVFDYSVQVLFVAIVICTILPVFLLPAAVIAFIFFCIGKLYVRNALATRKEIAAARSPLFSTLGDATAGIVTIRAFDRVEYFVSRYKTQTDRYNQVQLYGEGLDRWLEERSDMVGATVSFIVGLLCLSSGLSSGVTGFLISTGLEFTSRILYVVRSVNRNELSLNSVQRIIQYSTEIPWEEADSDKKQPPASWPHDGAIEFDGFSARYAENSNDVLHELSFRVEPGEKIGIVGESGCGKSSLSLALMRFIIPSNGTITVDGRRLSDTNLSDLRSRLTLVPQDPVLFQGTLRSNLDPENEEDDATLRSALQRSGFLKDHDNVGLDSAVSSGGSNLSQGQRQLVGLARALVRRSKVIILDEATASLDNESDQLVQRAIREEFEGCTLLTVAHRIETIVDYSRVLVLRAGRVAEFDTPHALLDTQNSEFRRMCEQTGSFDELYDKAKAAHGSAQASRSK
ncbi:uncharacterized protein JCM15063_006399 [Sporobolomyces koalae]|uniref:uncharacterized protein n=1 Tax=Sporobolomyces koalae TaxID=500713 RepID=UPI00317F2FFA